MSSADRTLCGVEVRFMCSCLPLGRCFHIYESGDVCSNEVRWTVHRRLCIILSCWINHTCFAQKNLQLPILLSYDPK